MTHGNDLCFESGGEWVELLSELMMRHEEIDGIKELFKKRMEDKNKVWEWKQQGVDMEMMDATHQSGFVKIAYSYGFKHLKEIVNNCK